METGGVSKSMATLMNVIDRNRYDVSLMIVSPTGPFMDLLPKDLRLITNPVWEALSQRISGFGKLIKLGHPILAFGHGFRLAISVFDKSIAGRLLAKLMPGLNEEFDTVVDFNGQQQLYYMVDKLRAKKKITFFHNDYKKWPYYYKADKKYYPKVHSIWSISKLCVSSLRDIFPNQGERIFMMENISSLRYIQNLALDKAEELKEDKLSLLTLGHVCERKGSHWAIEAASILKRHGIDFRWYFLGANPEAEKYIKLCEEVNVSEEIVFLGVRENPYPYLKNASIVVHPSKFEGKSIALDEAKLLCKPIVVTNFSTVNDQFADRHNASICEMTPKSIAESIEELIREDSLRNKYEENLKAEARDNTKEIEKLYQIFDE